MHNVYHGLHDRQKLNQCTAKAGPPAFKNWQAAIAGDILGPVFCGGFIYRLIL